MDWKKKFIDMLFPLNSSDTQIESAYILKHKNLPEYVYKYRSISESSKNNLREGTVWLADPTTLNDPYECAHQINFALMQHESFKSPPPELLEKFNETISLEIIESLKHSDNPIQTLVNSLFPSQPESHREQVTNIMVNAMRMMNEDLARDAVSSMKSAFKLCSFSERVDSTLMWAHYANYHKGFCIEYGIKELPPTDLVSRLMYPVIYSDVLLDLTMHVIRGIDHPEFNVLFPNQLGLRKTVDWAYEQEWRLLFSNGIIDTAQSYPMPQPSMVYLGSHIAPNDQNEIISICEEINVPVKKMQHSPIEYKMLALSVEDADRKSFTTKT